MNQVAPKKEFTVNDLELCDVLHAYGEGSNHVAMITGILRDETGEIVKIEVSEAVRTNCRRRLFSIEDFYGRFGELYKTSKVIDFGICLAQELGFRPSDVTKVSIGDLRVLEDSLNSLTFSRSSVK
jgi:Mg2+/Co2+ transporter CorC